MRIAFVHDWLLGMRGGEKCLERLVSLFPDSEIFTLFHRRGSVSPVIESRPVHSSYLQRVPGWTRFYRHLLPLFPSAAQWKIEGFDAVVSLSHCVAKAARSPEGVPHICYCFTPMRYAWHMKDQYFGSQRSMTGWARDRVLDRIRRWDQQTNDRVDDFIAISKTVAGRIQECYSRQSQVIFPPVDVNFYQLSTRPRRDYYLVVSALAPYKRIELADAACRRLGRPLVVIGSGQDESKLQAQSGPGTTWLGWQSDEEIRRHLQSCRALIFPGEEDFGIVPVEAQACGTPVIAFGRGGVTETVVGLDRGFDPPTGLFFEQQTVDSLCEGISQFERRSTEYHFDAIRKHALQFSTERFDSEIVESIRAAVSSNSVVSRAA